MAAPGTATRAHSPREHSTREWRMWHAGSVPGACRGRTSCGRSASQRESVTQRVPATFFGGKERKGLPARRVPWDTPMQRSITSSGLATVGSARTMDSAQSKRSAKRAQPPRASAPSSRTKGDTHPPTRRQRPMPRKHRQMRPERSTGRSRGQHPGGRVCRKRMK
jgi:hypothetical protein